MSRWAELGTGLATIAYLFAAGCASPVSPRCDPLPCPYTTVDLKALGDSMMAWTYRDLNLPTQVATGFVPDPVMGSFDCAFKFSTGRISRFGAAGNDEVELGAITLTCAAGPYPPFDLTISALGDIRDWPAGSFALVAPPGSVTITGFGGTNCHVVSLGGLTLNVTVETASGGSAPFPQLVTDDYARVFRVDFDTASATTACPDFTSVDGFKVMSGVVSLHLSQTRDDYAANPDAICQCID